MDDEDLLTLLSDCNSYTTLQHELESSLRSGHLFLIKARKNTRHIDSIDCREEIKANCGVDISLEGEYSEWREKPKVDPIILITPLPPPDLKYSQKSFQKALTITMMLASKSNQIQKILKKEKNESLNRNQENNNCEDNLEIEKNE